MKPTTKQSPFRPFSSIFSARKSSEKRSPLSTQKTSQSDTVSPSETSTIKVQKDNTPNSNTHENAEVDESNDLELKSAQFFEKCLKFLETTLKDYGKILFSIYQLTTTLCLGIYHKQRTNKSRLMP